MRYYPGFAALPLHASAFARKKPPNTPTPNPGDGQPVREPCPRGLLHVRFLSSVLLTDLIDLGHRQHLIFARDKGIVLDEPSVVAIRHEGGPHGKRSSRPWATRLKAMLGKVPGNIEAIRPMKDGVIADFVITEQMIKQFIKMVHRVRCSRPARASSSACPAAPPRSSAAPSGRGRGRGRHRCVPDRGTHGRWHWRRAARERGLGLDGGWTLAAAPPRWA